MKSGFTLRAKSKQLLAFQPLTLGQSYPQHCPYPEQRELTQSDEALGAALSIREVAQLIGCSSWTVRQRYIPAGLPHHRLSPKGKLLFYTRQVNHWLLVQQRKGGMAL